ncbi:hypothetical protein K7H91_13070 [Martelella mediterranea]|uniref:hypothetical protein n=1 Tax=Martelella mediterranea TaxID=293089 RepID=UPI001E431145|nr:hypothetical protein [Martelella mediterranea]MCD1634703.1 hypothetical protein [Martelella mediterranea]
MTRLLMAFAACSVFACEASAWSFETHPQPTRPEMTFEEWEFATSELDYNPRIPDCGDYLRGHYEIYEKRYPAFADEGTEEARYELWREYIQTDSAFDDLNTCMTLPYVMAMFRLAKEKLSDSDLIYCGRFTRNPETEGEVEFAALMERLQDAATRGSEAALLSFLITDDGEGMTPLNPDVLSYLRESLKDTRTAEEQRLFDDEFIFRHRAWNQDNLADQLSPERQRFVEQAAKDRDLASVLATTGPCGETAWRDPSPE